MLRLLGDQDLAAQYVGLAKSKLFQLRQAMNNQGLSTHSLRYELPDAHITVSKCYGVETITIEGIGGRPMYISGQVIQADGTWAWMVEKRDRNSALIWQKVYNSSPASYAVSPNGIAINDKTQNLFLAGKVYPVTPGYPNWQVECREPYGGSQVWQLVPSIEGEAYAVAADDTGVYSAGRQRFGTSVTDHDWRIEKRSLTDGTLLWQQTYSVESVPGDPSTHVDTEAYAVDVANGQVVIAGLFGGFPTVECRNASDGSLVWLKQLNNDSGSLLSGWLNGCKIVGNYVVVVGTQYNDPVSMIYDWRVIKLNLADGSLVWSTSYHMASNSQAMALSIGSDIHVCGFDSVNTYWRVEGRSLVDGTLLWADRPDGLTNDASNQSEAVAIVERGNTIYAGGWYMTPATAAQAQYYMERYGLDGTLQGKTFMAKYPNYSQITGMVVGR